MMSVRLCARVSPEYVVPRKRSQAAHYVEADDEQWWGDYPEEVPVEAPRSFCGQR